MKKQTQDLLQAELTSTLKRRKPVVINEPAKYDYPIYDDDGNNNNNNKTNKNNESSQSMDTNANTTTVKPLNVNAVLSVVTGIKIPDVQYHPQTSAPKTPVNDKPKITHGKANFTIRKDQTECSKENKPNVQMSEAMSNGHTIGMIGPKTQIKSPENADAKLHRPSYFTSHMTMLDKSNSGKSVADAESQVEKCKSIFLIKSQKSIDNDKCKPQKSPQRTEFKSKFEPATVVELPKDEIKKKHSVDETKDDVPFGSVANKKALFEKSPTNGIASKNILTKHTQFERNVANKPATVSISSGKFNTLNGQRKNSQSNNQPKPGVTTVSLNKNVSYGSLARPQGKDRVDHFERAVHTVNETTSTNHNGKFETKQFEQKTVVSFSKDLLNAPNNYPEQIRVKKTVITKSSHTGSDNPFQNIRFSIQTNGQVIPKPKNL